MSHALYGVIYEDVFNDGLMSSRIRSLVDSAIKYNSLIQPGRSLVYHFYMGEKWQYPCLNDLSTLNGGLTVTE